MWQCPGEGTEGMDAEGECSRPCYDSLGGVNELQVTCDIGISYLSASLSFLHCAHNVVS